MTGNLAAFIAAVKRVSQKWDDWPGLALDERFVNAIDRHAPLDTAIERIRARRAVRQLQSLADEIQRPTSEVETEYDDKEL